LIAGKAKSHEAHAFRYQDDSNLIPTKQSLDYNAGPTSTITSPKRLRLPFFICSYHEPSCLLFLWLMERCETMRLYCIFVLSPLFACKLLQFSISFLSIRAGPLERPRKHLLQVIKHSQQFNKLSKGSMGKRNDHAGGRTQGLGVTI
jgi:hypothetical protein